MSTIDILLSTYFSHPKALRDRDPRRGELYVCSDLPTDIGAELTKLLSPWARLDLSFAVAWISEHAFVLLTPDKLYCYRQAPSTQKI